ncbi:hypothetical protein GCM10027340_08080 [Marinomonas epiphytica]
MTLTLLGMKQRQLIERLKSYSVWRFACLHSFGMMFIVALLGYFLSFSPDLLLACVAAAATGSLFATPAIVRALGFDALQAMAMTIATTLILPVSIFITLMLFQDNEVSLDLQTYFLRLVVFIFGPMVFSFVVHALMPEKSLNSLLQKVSPYTIILVFTFPFGLIGGFRVAFDEDPLVALNYLLIAIGLCVILFVGAFIVYRNQGKEIALTAALTSTNRNVLLTYTIAGSLLGPAFIPLLGALQLPTYLLPVIVRWLNRVMR